MPLRIFARKVWVDWATERLMNHEAGREAADDGSTEPAEGVGRA
jgi:hypothetical protein